MNGTEPGPRRQTEGAKSPAQFVLQARLDQVLDRIRIEHRLGVGQLQRAQVLTSAIYINNLPGDIARGGAEQEDGCIGNFLDVSVAA